VERVHVAQQREVEAHLASIVSRIGRLGVVGAVALAASLAAAAALAGLSAAWLAEPIRAIAHGSRRLAAGDLDHRLSVRAGGELGEAAQAFNTMASHMGASARALRALRECDRAIAHEPEEHELLQVVCRILSGITGYRGAWVALAEHGAEHRVAV